MQNVRQRSLTLRVINDNSMADKVALAIFMRLLNEGCHCLADWQRQGGALNRFIANKLECKLNAMERTLTGIARNDLLASIDCYKQGVSLVEFDAVFDKVDGEAVGSLKQLIKSDVTPGAKERFKEARQLANRAVNNTALSPDDRISAMHFLVSSTLLDTDDTIEALTLCKGFLEKMHAWPGVRSDFKTEVAGSWALGDFKRKERRKIISSVCEVNRIVFDVIQTLTAVQMEGGERVLQKFFVWPCIEIESRGKVKEKIDPLRDSRLRKALRQDEEREDCFVVWSFGNKGKDKEHNLHLPHSIATNSQGQFIVVETKTTKVFDSSGNYRYTLNLPFEDARYGIVDVDTDREGKVYLLVEIMANKEQIKHCYEVAVFNTQGVHVGKFSLRPESKGRKLTVNSCNNNPEVLVLEGARGLHAIVEVYDSEGLFVTFFGGRILEDSQDIVAANDGRIFVLDKCHRSGHKSVREFSAEKTPLRSFDVDIDSVALTFDSASEHVIIVSASFVTRKQAYCERVSIYKPPCDKGYQRPVRSMELDEVCEVVNIPNQNIAVTTTGRIAVVVERINAPHGNEKGRKLSSPKRQCSIHEEEPRGRVIVV